MKQLELMVSYKLLLQVLAMLVPSQKLLLLQELIRSQEQLVLKELTELLSHKLSLLEVLTESILSQKLLLEK